jgi:hypothetical protein
MTAPTVNKPLVAPINGPAAGAGLIQAPYSTSASLRRR